MFLKKQSLKRKGNKMYVYIRLLQGDGEYLYTVGFYNPDDKFIPESDYDIAEDAAKRVAWLNGSSTSIEGNDNTEKPKQKVVVEVWHGIADVKTYPDNIEVEIIDKDAEGRE